MDVGPGTKYFSTRYSGLPCPSNLSFPARVQQRIRRPGRVSIFYNVETTPMPDDLPLPRVPFSILRRLLPRAERDEVLADLRAEFVEIAAADGLPAAKGWLWRQALGSAP